MSLCTSGVRPSGSYPLRCGLPANPGHRHGNHAGENHHHQVGLHHLCPGKRPGMLGHLGAAVVIPTRIEPSLFYWDLNHVETTNGSACWQL